MQLPPLTRYYFSYMPNKERACRWLCFGVVVSLVVVLYIFWTPLRSAEFTYSMVSVTVENVLVFLFFQVITTLGSEGFFLIFLSAIYWSYNKLLGFWGLVVMPLSIFVTSEIPKDLIRLPRPDVPGVTVPTYTFPSGHTSGAVSVWGYLAIMLKQRWLWIGALVIMFLVGLSRVMLGYHFPGDVLGGIVTGIIFLVIFFSMGVRLVENNWKEKIGFYQLICIALIIPLAMSFIPATFAPRLMGYMAGASLGYLLQKEILNFSTVGDWRQHLGRSLLGMSVIAVIIPGFDLVLPEGIHLITYIQHALATFWSTFLAPWCFIKVGLLHK